MDSGIQAAYYGGSGIIRAFDGSDLSSYDDQKTSASQVTFDKDVQDNNLTALPVKPEPDIRPADLETNHDLLNGDLVGQHQASERDTREHMKMVYVCAGTCQSDYIGTKDDVPGVEDVATGSAVEYLGSCY